LGGGGGEGRIECKTAFIINLGNRWSSQFHAPVALSPEKAPKLYKEAVALSIVPANDITRIGKT